MLGTRCFFTATVAVFVFFPTHPADAEVQGVQRDQSSTALVAFTPEDIDSRVDAGFGSITTTAAVSSMFDNSTVDGAFTASFEIDPNTNGIRGYSGSGIINHNNEFVLTDFSHRLDFTFDVVDTATVFDFDLTLNDSDERIRTNFSTRMERNSSGGSSEITLPRSPADLTYDLAAGENYTFWFLVGSSLEADQGNFNTTFDFTATFSDAEPPSFIWSNGTGGNYSEPTNWQDNVVPAELDEARVDLAGTYAIHLTESVVNDRFLVGGNALVARPDVDLRTHTMTTRQLIVDQNGSLNIDGSADGSLLKTDFVNVDASSEFSGNVWIQPRNATPLSFDNDGILRLGDRSNATPLRSQLVGAGGGPEPAEFDAHVTIRGDYNQSSTGTLTTTLTAAKAVNQGRDSTVANAPQTASDLWVTGNATLDGKLSVSLAPGYVPQHGDSFRIVKADNVSGSLDFDSPPVGFNDLPLKATKTDKGVHAVVPQRVVLAFNYDMPYTWEPVSVFDQVLAFVSPDSAASTPAFVIGSPSETAALETYLRSLRQHVEQQFAASGIEAIEFFYGSPRDDAINVYFIDPSNAPSSNLLGQAMTPIDRFNLEAKGDVVVVVNSYDPMNPTSVEIDAETITHEIGHVLGLRHVDPVGSIAVMDYDSNPGDVELFVDEVNPIREAPQAGGRLFPDNHNPRYHLERYVDGVPHEDLIAQGTLPGTWDLPGPIFEDLDASFRLRLSGTATDDTTLFNVIVYSSPTEPSEVVTMLAQFSEITLAEFAAESFRVTSGEAIGFVAATTPTGPHDLLLASGNPFDSSSLRIYPGLGDNEATLQLRADNPLGYVNFAEFAIDVSTIPEPNSLILLVLGLNLACYRRLR